jgi:hypothetical protein
MLSWVSPLLWLSDFNSSINAAATNATAMTGEPIPNGSDTISYDATNIIITVAAAYTRAWAVI